MNSTSGAAALEHWTREDDPRGIAWLTLDKQRSSANTLSRDVLDELARLLDDLEREVPRAVVFRSGKRGGFIAGADVREFTTLVSAEQAYSLVRRGQTLMERIESLSCPTVAAINGYALGGGLELAMACRYRVAADGESRSIGLPEVRLGIHPGFGGTVRSVRLAGAPAAMDLMLTGRSLRPQAALRAGLVDRVVPAQQLEEAAVALIQNEPPPRRAPLTLRLLDLPGVRTVVAMQMEKRVRQRARPEHYPAPYAIIELWRRHGGGGVAAMEAEARSISALAVSPAAQNLVRVFLLQEQLKSLARRELPEARRVHVVGAGVMGGDIAAWCALRGLEVTLQDQAADSVEKAIARAGKLFERRVRDPAKRRETAARLQADVAGAGVAQADVVIEAIFEDLEAKRALYADIEPQLKADAVLATNTSSLRLELLQEGLQNPGRLLGLHFFNPVARLPLVEVVRGTDSRDETIDRGIAFTRQIGKLPLPCTSAPGFLVNRILFPYLAEAMFLHQEGVPMEVIDAAAEDFGMPMGPLELADTVGLDVAYHVSRILGEAFHRPEPEGLKARVDAGELGRKSGRGFYEYVDGKARKQGVEAYRAPPDIQDRLILPMVNEAVACWADGVVPDLGLVDAGVVFGTGFAPFRGGPLKYACDVGYDTIRQRLQRLEQAHGPRFAPHAGWQQLPAVETPAVSDSGASP